LQVNYEQPIITGLESDHFRLSTDKQVRLDAAFLFIYYFSRDATGPILQGKKKRMCVCLCVKGEGERKK